MQILPDTGSPFNVAGWNPHCLTTSTAASVKGCAPRTGFISVVCPDLLILTDNTTVPVATVFAGYIAYDANRTCGGRALPPFGFIARGELSPPTTGAVPAGLYGLKTI